MPSVRLVDVATVAAYIGRTEKAVRHMVDRGQIPHVRIAGRLQFDIRKIDAWVEAASIGASS